VGRKYKEDGFGFVYTRATNLTPVENPVRIWLPSVQRVRLFIF
jgi:hypothetical protein